MTQEQMTVEGIEVFVEGEGEGEETVVMVHGWPDTHHLWDAQVALLKDRFRCARFTLPGYDITRPRRFPSLDEMVALFKAIVDAVSPGRPVTLLLHDWGAVYGYEFAHRHQDRVARIVGVDIGDTNTRAFLDSLPGKAKLGIVIYQWWLAAAWKIGGALGDRMTRSMARSLRCQSEPSRMGAQMNYPYWATWTGGLKGARRGLPHCPLLYLYGERKPFQFQSPQWLQAIAARPGSAVQGLPTGHWVMVQAPEAFNQRVRDWLTASPGTAA